MYKLIKNPVSGEVQWVVYSESGIRIPFDPANTDYQQFKQAALESKAELQDAEGNLLTPIEAKAYISTLP